jgi:hypothetical protein
MPRLSQLLAATLLAGLAAGAQTISFENGMITAGPTTAGDSLHVYVADLAEAPNLLGVTARTTNGLRFEPSYPLEPGMRYRVELDRAGAPSVVEVIEIPAANHGARTRVEAIYPSADQLPENLLRVYLHFSAPMSRGDAYSHLSLVDDATGEAVALPFLELEQELWDPAGRRLTVLFDPGRIKRGLVPNVEAGLPLIPGRGYRLVVSPEWLDAHAQPLERGFEKRFSVTESDFSSPVPPAWRIESPAAGSREPLVVSIGDPIDRALGLRLIEIVGSGQKVVSGEPALGERETRWTFTPSENWQAGRYRLQVEGTLEDPSGNSVLRPFEVLPGQPEDILGPAVSYLDFEVR